MRHISTKNAPTPGAYSQAVLVDPLDYKLLFLAGQTGNNPLSKDEEIVGGGIGPQTRAALENMLAIVGAAGGNARSFVSMDVYLKAGSDLAADREAFNVEYVKFFAARDVTTERGNMPARMQVWVSEIPLMSEDTLIEIRGIAAIPR